ncbi:unnamed protein product [Euphydryas editha]|uniref:Uncharacterized protein n=1 Tax=Euphydryas editha TaxID=104508 RepID=A0AAU9V042_EUPED|nr:unnamed protein product [Euphydryas editha]
MYTVNIDQQSPKQELNLPSRKSCRWVKISTDSGAQIIRLSSVRHKYTPHQNDNINKGGRTEESPRSVTDGGRVRNRNSPTTGAKPRRVLSSEERKYSLVPPKRAGRGGGGGDVAVSAPPRAARRPGGRSAPELPPALAVCYPRRLATRRRRWRRRRQHLAHNRHRRIALQ